MSRCVAALHLLVKIMGRKYHSLPLAFRQGDVNPQYCRECDSAFLVKLNGSSPDIVRSLEQLDEQTDRIKHALSTGDLDTAREGLRLADLMMQTTEWEVQGLQLMTESLIRTKCDLQDRGVIFEDDGLPMLASDFPNQPEHYQLARAWALSLRESKTALEIGFLCENAVASSVLFPMDEERILPEVSDGEFDYDEPSDLALDDDERNEILPATLSGDVLEATLGAHREAPGRHQIGSPTQPLFCPRCPDGPLDAYELEDSGDVVCGSCGQLLRASLGNYAVRFDGPGLEPDGPVRDEPRISAERTLGAQMVENLYRDVMARETRMPPPAYDFP